MANETTTTVPTTTTQYLSQRIAAAVEKQRADEAEQAQVRQAERNARRESAILELDQYLRRALDAELYEALGLRYDAQPHNGDYDWKATATFTLQPEGKDLRLTLARGSVARLYDPKATHYSELGYIYAQDGSQSLLTGIAAYRQHLANHDAARAARAAHEAQRAATLAPVNMRVIESDDQTRTIELTFDGDSAKIATLRRSGRVDLLELAPHWRVDERGYPSSDHYTLSREAMERLITAYTTLQAEGAATPKNAVGGDDQVDDSGLIDGIEVPF